MLAVDPSVCASIERKGNQHGVASGDRGHAHVDQVTALSDLCKGLALALSRRVRRVAQPIEGPGDAREWRQLGRIGQGHARITDAKPDLNHSRHQLGKALDQPDAGGAVDALQQ